MFFWNGTKLWIVLLDFVSWLWIGRFFESSQDCELTHVQSSSKNTFKKKGWVKLSVRQNFAVRSAGGCGSIDQVWPPLWPSVLPPMEGNTEGHNGGRTWSTDFLPISHDMFQKRSRSLQSQNGSHCSPMFTWTTETFAFGNAAPKQLIGIRWLCRWFGCWSFHFRFISMCKSHGERSSKRKFFCCAPWRWHGSRIWGWGGAYTSVRKQPSRSVPMPRFTQKAWDNCEQMECRSSERIHWLSRCWWIPLSD